MHPGTFRVPLPHLPRRISRDSRQDRQEFAARAHRLQLNFGGPLEVVEIVPGFGDVGCTDHDAVVFNKQDILVAEEGASAAGDDHR